MKVDERLYLEVDLELGIKRTDVEEGIIRRSIDRYTRAIEYCGTIGGNWLDAGCGSGYGTNMASKVADSIIGVDISEMAIAYARRHYGSEKVKFISGDMGRLSVIGKFNVILVVESIEHINEVAQCMFLASAYKLLARNGVAIITTPMTTDGGLNPTNPYHKNEFTLLQFMDITSKHFDETSYIIDKPILFTDGKMARQIFGICSKLVN